jgi:hypothetical protein
LAELSRARAEDASRHQLSMPDVIVVMEDWPRRHGDTEERLTAILCGVRRLAAAVCRTGLPGRAATVSRVSPPGQAPAKRGGSKLPHSTWALPCRASEACERRRAKMAVGRSPNSFRYFPSLCLRVSVANGLASNGGIRSGAFGALDVVD